VPALPAQWGAFVLSQNAAIHVQGRLVMFGDHTYVPKDGRRMPGAVSMHQHSETQSKPSYFRVHCRGAIALGALVQCPLLTVSLRPLQFILPGLFINI
jgi:hypothetical protein